MPKKQPVSRYIVPIVIIIISISFFAVMIKSKPKPVQKMATERAWSVESMLLKRDIYKPVLQLYGRTITGKDVQLTAAVEADVEERLVHLGDSVEKGQLLLSLDKTRLEQALLQRKAELSEIETLIKAENHQFESDSALLKQEQALLKITNNALKRAKTLEKSLMASNSQLDDAKRASIQQKLSITRLKANLSNHPTRLAQFEAKQQLAQSRLVLASYDLENTQIRSPVDGVITSVSVDKGEFIRKGTALFSVSDTNDIEIQALVPQSHYQSLQRTFQHNGIVNARVNVDENTKHSLSATLTRLSSNINKGQAGSYAFFHLKNKETKLLIGQTLNLYVELQEKPNSIALPQDAIYGTDSIFTIKEQRLERVQIKWLGETFVKIETSLENVEKNSEKNSEIKKYILIEGDKLKNNDEILVSKFANAMHGLKVKSNFLTKTTSVKIDRSKSDMKETRDSSK